MGRLKSQLFHFIFCCSFMLSITLGEWAQGQEPICQTSLDSIACNSLSQQLLPAYVGNEMINHALAGRSAQVVELRTDLNQAVNLAMNCHSISSCRAVHGIISTQSIGQGWSLETKYEAFDNSGECEGQVVGTLKKGDTEIRISINQITGVLTYMLPQTSCRQGAYHVERTLYLDETGLLFTDVPTDSERENDVQFPGNRYVPNAVRTPTFHPLENGNIQFRLASGITIDVDPNIERIVDSNFFDPEMFNPDTCQTHVQERRNGKDRISTPVALKRRADRNVSLTLLDFGGVRQAEILTRHLNTLPRE